MNVRAKIAELTKDVRSQTDLDALVSRFGGLGNLFNTEFSGADRGEFMYEWDSMKLSIKKQTRSI